MTVASLHGFLNLYKPKGITSNKAISIVRRILGVRKIGHAGTLDPLAEGVLPLAIGEATKVIQFVVDGEKEYEFTIKWGDATSTDDAEGEVIKRSDVLPGIDDIRNAIAGFVGEIEQTPPKFSAIKISGRRAHDMARRGEEFEVPSRCINIHSYELLGVACDDDKRNRYATFRVSCGKGTYIRSLARDLAIKLGTVGHVVMLKRTMVAQKFYCSDAVDIKTLDKESKKVLLSKAWVSIKDSLGGIPAVCVSDEELLRRFCHGQKIEIHALSVIKEERIGKHILLQSPRGLEIGLGVFCGDGLIAPFKRFNIDEELIGSLG